MGLCVSILNATVVTTASLKQEPCRGFSNP